MRTLALLIALGCAMAAQTPSPSPAETTPAPLTKTEKTAIGTQLQRREVLLQQIAAIQKQLQDIDRDTQEIAVEAYAARKIDPKDWALKADLTWAKPVAAAPAVAEEKK